MKAEFQSIAFTSKQELKSVICEKVHSLVHFYKDVIGCEIFLRFDNSHTRDNKVCKIKLAIPGNDLLATARSKTFDQATLKIVKALKRQIQNLKTKLINKRNNITKIKSSENE
ncbi:MAG: HPF/RaiA family ribosome-associated protein [Bacteroidota bacterium]|nr:HPF/RaiA family ribosome-associated protein [Bacteroidota bacterium]